jgi:methyltransferase (TIGR00027 family)
MRQPGPPNQSVTETAWWTATIRAEETTRNDALFRDPFAHRLAGESDTRIASVISWGQFYTWPVVVRTYLFDWYIAEQVGRGIDTVVNLGAGLDARPYRMDLPKSLHWIEVDHSEVLSYKESVLHGERPRCAVERVPLDLTHSAARRALFDLLGQVSQSSLVVSEGLVVYLSTDEVAHLAVDLAAQRSFRCWILDLVTPEVLFMLRLNMIYQFGQLSEAYQFGPVQGADFFTRYGWCPVDVRSVVQTAVSANRLPLAMRFFPTFPLWIAAEGWRPGFSVCLFANKDTIDDGR